nr:MAG: hypothetical protein DIU74_02670 [Pseudomonadota bacterium]
MVWLLYNERVRYEYEAAVSAAVKQSSMLARVLEQHTEKTLRAVQQTLDRVADEYERQGNGLDLYRLREQGALDSSMLQSIGVLDETGDLVLASATNRRMDMSDRDYFQALRGDPARRIAIGRPVKGRLSHKWIIPIAVPIRKADGGFGGAVIAGVEPAYFIDFYQVDDFGPRGSVMLGDLKGYVLARRAGSVDSFDSDIRGGLLMNALREAPVGDFVGTGQFENTPRYVSYRTLEAFGVFVSVGLAIEDALAPFYERRRVQRAIAFATTFFIPSPPWRCLRRSPASAAPGNGSPTTAPCWRRSAKPPRTPLRWFRTARSYPATAASAKCGAASSSATGSRERALPSCCACI